MEDRGGERGDGMDVGWGWNARQLRLAVWQKYRKRHFPKTIAMQSDGGEITHLFRTNSFTRLFPTRQTDRRERGGQHSIPSTDKFNQKLRKQPPRKIVAREKTRKTLRPTRPRMPTENEKKMALDNGEKLKQENGNGWREGETEHFIACRRRIWRLDDTSDTSFLPKTGAVFSLTNKVWVVRGGLQINIFKLWTWGVFLWLNKY